MPDYGGYEVTRELYQSGRTTVYAARRSGSKRAYAVKVFNPFDEQGRRRTDSIAAFLSAAELQKRVRAKAPKRWAPIHAAGECPEGAYFVTDYYSRSLQKVVEGRIAFDLSTLHGIVAAIIQALGDLDRVATRGHGNLQKSNVFIAGTGRLHKAPILLAEPAPLTVEAKATRLADYNALGVLIAEFVRKREHEGWPIEDGPEWTGLGRYGNEWREFCNFLLNPQPAEDDLAIAALKTRFARLGGRGATGTIKTGAVVIPLLVLASPFVYLRFAPFNSVPERFQDFAERIGNLPPDVETVPPEFGKLNADWYEWYGALQSELSDPDRKARWQVDAFLRDRVLAPISGEDQLDPRRLTGEQRSFESLRAQPPASAKRGSVVRRVLRAERTLRGVGEALKSWPARQELAAAQKRLEALGWTAAEALQRPNPPPLESGNLTRDIDDTMQLIARAHAIERAWADVGARGQILSGTGDPVLSGIVEYHRRELASVSLADLDARLTETVKAMAARVAFAQGDWVRQVGRERWLREGFVRDFRGEVTADVIGRWEREFRDYYLVSPAQDPRQKVDWSAVSSRANEGLRTMASEERSLPAPPPGTLSPGTKLANEGQGLRARSDEITTTPVLVKDVAATTDKIAALQRDYADFTARVLAALDELRPNPADWLSRVRAATVGPLPSLNREWQTRRERLLGGATPESLLANEANFRALRGRLRQAQDFIAAIDGPAAIGRVPAIDSSGLPDDVMASVAAAETARRDETAAALIARATWQADLPQGSVDVLTQSAEGRAALNALQTWREEAARFARDLQRMAVLLAEGRGLDEGLRDALAAWDGKPVATQVSATGRAADIVRDVRALSALPQETNSTVLVKTASDAGLSVGLVAWRQLGKLPDWPATLDQLEQEANLVAALRAKIFKNVADTSRRVALAGEVATGGKARWRRMLARADTDELVGGVFARMERIGVPMDELSDGERFNFLLYQAKSRPWARLGEVDTKNARDQFVKDVTGLPGVGARADIVSLVSRLRALDLEPKGISTVPADIGPGKAGWDGEFVEDGHRAIYRWKSALGAEFQMEFVLVEPPDGVPFYLCTQAVSLGQFVDLIESRPEGRDVISLMPSWIKDVAGGSDTDARLGPQVWRVAPRRPLGKRVNDSGITLNNRWMAFLDSRWPTPLYADDSVAATPPTWKDPMQNLPPRAAQMFLDRILGARLATPEEWAGVARIYGDLAKPGAAGANFADQSWLAQRNYLITQGAQFEFPWPDGGVFRPGLESDFKTRQAAEPYAPEVKDGKLWFAEVDSGSGVFHHLFGNVATYLYEPDKKQFYVAGGSALSPKEIDPRQAYPVDGYAEGFSDVGMRPAFDASPALIIRSELIRLLRNQLYLRY